MGLIFLALNQLLVGVNASVPEAKVAPPSGFLESVGSVQSASDETAPLQRRLPTAMLNSAGIFNMETRDGGNGSRNGIRGVLGRPHSYKASRFGKKQFRQREKKQLDVRAARLDHAHAPPLETEIHACNGKRKSGGWKGKLAFSASSNFAHLLGRADVVATASEKPSTRAGPQMESSMNSSLLASTQSPKVTEPSQRQSRS